MVLRWLLFPRPFRHVLPHLRDFTRVLRRASNGWSEESLQAARARLRALETAALGTHPDSVEVAGAFVLQFQNEVSHGVLSLLRLRAVRAQVEGHPRIRLDPERNATASDTCQAMLNEVAEHAQPRLLQSPLANSDVLLRVDLLDPSYVHREIGTICGRSVGAALAVGVDLLIERSTRSHGSRLSGRMAWFQRNLILSTISTDGRFGSVEQPRRKLEARARTPGFAHCEVIWAWDQDFPRLGPDGAADANATQERFPSPAPSVLLERLRALLPPWLRRDGSLFARSYRDALTLVLLCRARSVVWTLAICLCVVGSWPAAGVEVGRVEIVSRDPDPTHGDRTRSLLDSPNAQLADVIEVSTGGRTGVEHGLGFIRLHAVVHDLARPTSPTRFFAVDSTFAFKLWKGPSGVRLRLRLADLVTRDAGGANLDAFRGLQVLQAVSAESADEELAQAVADIERALDRTVDRPLPRQIGLVMYLDHALCPWEICPVQARSRPVNLRLDVH